MSEKRKQCISLCLKADGKTSVKIELFPSDQWPDVEGSAPGLYRIRTNDAWYCPDDQKYTFLTLDAVTKIFSEEVSKDLGGDCSQNAEECTIKSGAPVRMFTGEMIGDKKIYTLSRVATDPPIKGYDGRWYVGVILFGKGARLVPVDTLEVQ